MRAIFLLLIAAAAKAQFLLQAPAHIVVPLVVQPLSLAGERAIALRIDPGGDWEGEEGFRLGISISTEIGVIGIASPVSEPLQADVSRETLEHGAPTIIFYASPPVLEVVLRRLFFFTTQDVGNATNKITVQLLSGKDGAVMQRLTVPLIQDMTEPCTPGASPPTSPPSCPSTAFLFLVMVLACLCNLVYIARLKRRLYREKEDAISLIKITTSIVDDGHL